jgi:hypothetical protein
MDNANTDLDLIIKEVNQKLIEMTLESMSKLRNSLVNVKENSDEN